MAVNHLKLLENELLDKSKANYQLREKISYLMTVTLEWFDYDQKVLFYAGLLNGEILQCVFNFVKIKTQQLQTSHTDTMFLNQHLLHCF